MQRKTETESSTLPRSRGPVELRRSIVAQFGRPSGFWGRIAGLVMAHRPSNRERSLWTLDLLDLAPSDRLLEIGFGPGVALRHAAARLTRGAVIGVDHSRTMHEVAAKRNAAAIASGRVRLVRASVSDLPRFEQPFDKIVAVNSFGFWQDPDGALEDLLELLAPGGCLAITFQPRSPGATDSTSRARGEEIAARLRAAGFVSVRVELRAMKPVAAVCVIGLRRSEGKE